ncbi:carbonic anhydrase, chloroplastic [Zostera marina]|uniref:Carbonic anhydrase n=1 Tax=Zostera marina TaxID=29655 RepID=A0A0K9PWW6_ZOSMR|nr:carbonic anhydrase, chloroplastic [Zostera marina]
MAYSLRLTPPSPSITTSRHVDFDSSSGAMLSRMRNGQLRGFNSIRITYNPVIKASRDPFEMTQERTKESKSISIESDDGIDDPFVELKQRFLCFKENCMDNPVQYEKLSKAQEPKFMVIACADSRVCPSRVLGFTPGEAFTIRNVGNIVPPFQYGTSETNAALQFAVNTLEVSNILVVGHSQCGGIQALMSMEEDETNQGNFTKNWVSIAKSARLSTKAAAGHLNFEQQCRHCEKESLNGSLFNLLTYPWIEKRVVDGKLSIHGGYYNFIDCTFEKWSLVYRQNMQGGSKYGMKNHTFWS